MEVAIIDWKRIDSRFVIDEQYEHINAPRWVDLTAPDQPVDDEAWFCRPECNHPKTVDDFFKQTPISKRSGTLTQILPLGDRNRREAILKKRGLSQPSTSLSEVSISKCDKFVEDCENFNHNYLAPPNNKANKLIKETIKSSTDKQTGNCLKKEETPKLKSTLSAKNLFSGRDILHQVTEFCNELKRLATRASEKENRENESERRNPLEVENQRVSKCLVDYSSVDLDEKERKPLLEMLHTREAVEKCNLQEMQKRKKKAEEAENIVPISVDLKNIKGKGQENLLQVRTYPPSPQCFSGTGKPNKATPPKTFRSRPMEKGILQELEQSNKEVRNGDSGEKGSHGKGNSIIADREEARSLDIFWFLKRCTLSS